MTSTIEKSYDNGTMQQTTPSTDLASMRVPFAMSDVLLARIDRLHDGDNVARLLGQREKFDVREIEELQIPRELGSINNNSHP